MLAAVDWGLAGTGIGTLAIIVGPLLGYVAAARKMSGKIGSSDADALWNESRSIRDDYRTRLLQSEERVLALEARVASLEGINNELLRVNRDLNDKIDGLEALVRELRETIAKLEATIAEQNHRERP